MATIVFLEEIDPIAGSRSAVTFATSQAGPYAKRRPSPINPRTTHRDSIRSKMRQASRFYYDLTLAQMKPWIFWAKNQGMTPPFTNAWYQLGYAGFMTVELNALIAGDPLYVVPPANLPHAGVNFTNLVRIDKDTIRATFNPSPAGADERIFLRQTLPGPGVRRLDQANGYITEISALNPTSPYDFTTHFQHLAGWHCRYWTGTQEDTGRRSTEDLWEF